MKKKKEIQEELEALAPFLAKRKIQQDFRVPEDYFDNLADNVLSKVTSAPSLEDKSSPILDTIIGFMQQMMQPKMAIGLASLLFVLLATYFVVIPSKTTNPIALLDAAEINQYITNNIGDFEEDLFEVLIDVDNDLSFDFLEENLEEADLNQLMDSMLEDMDSETLEELL